MHGSRRDFLVTAAGAVAAVGLPTTALADEDEPGGANVIEQ